jgi:YidC/Oxa1 family membrane protein insertase
MRELSDTVLGAFSAVLEFLHGLFEPVFGIHSWGWAIIALTILVRVLLLPLAIKQTRSMKAMQTLQPQIKAIQTKYKVDRELMRKDPEKYRQRRGKMNEEMMALYQREGANPAASCLPLLAQAPIFLALFWTLRDEADLIGAPFYFVTSVADGGLESLVSGAGWPGWLLIVLMSGTLFWSQKQMMARNAASMVDNPMAQQQKILLYVMPIFLAVISFQFPLGILLYWVTTNFWQIVQQAIILRESTKGVTVAAGAVEGDGGAGGEVRRSKGATSGRRDVPTIDPAIGRTAAGGPPVDPEATDSPKSEEVSNNGSGDGEGAGKGPDVPSGGTSGPDPSPRGRLPRRGGGSGR